MTTTSTLLRRLRDQSPTSEPSIQPQSALKTWRQQYWWPDTFYDYKRRSVLTETATRLRVRVRVGFTRVYQKSARRVTPPNPKNPKDSSNLSRCWTLPAQHRVESGRIAGEACSSSGYKNIVTDSPTTFYWLVCYTHGMIHFLNRLAQRIQGLPVTLAVFFVAILLKKYG